MKRIRIGGILVDVLRGGDNFNYRISREEALRLLLLSGEKDLPFTIMCKEYGIKCDEEEDEDGEPVSPGADDWVGMVYEDVAEDGQLAEHWQNFEIMI